MVYAFQVAFLLLMILSKVHRGLASDGEDDTVITPSSCSVVRYEQDPVRTWNGVFIITQLGIE